MIYLQPKHEKFVREYFRNGRNGTRAYMSVYPNAGYLTARVEAYKLLRKNRKVMIRCEELARQVMKRSEITIEKILNDYQTAIDMATQQGKAGEIVAGATAQAKLVGLLRDRIEAGGPGAFDNVDNISEIVELVAAQAGPEAALAFTKAMGLNKETNASEQPSTELLEAMDSPSEAVN